VHKLFVLLARVRLARAFATPSSRAGEWFGAYLDWMVIGHLSFVVLNGGLLLLLLLPLPLVLSLVVGACLCGCGCVGVWALTSAFATASSRAGDCLLSVSACVCVCDIKFMTGSPSHPPLTHTPTTKKQNTHTHPKTKKNKKTAAIRTRLQSLCALSHILGGGHQHGGGGGPAGAAQQQDAARLLATLQAQPELVSELVELVRGCVCGLCGCGLGGVLFVCLFFWGMLGLSQGVTNDQSSSSSSSSPLS
jgi:hypothetical protein